MSKTEIVVSAALVLLVVVCAVQFGHCAEVLKDAVRDVAACKNTCMEAGADPDGSELVDDTCWCEIDGEWRKAP